MQTYNVVMVATAEWEVEIEAENEDRAKDLAEHYSEDRDLSNLLKDSGSVSASLPEAVEAWEINGG